ncbi:MAG: YidB family protein [Steroidobacteraceae bacterium]
MMTVMQRRMPATRVFWGQLSSDEFGRAVDDLIHRHGAVAGIVNRMEQMGLGQVANSWLSSDVRQPILSEQLHTLFGTGALRALAAKLDLQPRELVRHLSQALPRAIHQLASSTRSTAHASVWAHSPP